MDHADVRLRALGVGLLALLAAVLTTWVALGTQRGQSLDYRGFLAVAITPGGRRQALSWLGNISVGAVLVACLICVVIAVSRRSVRLAVAGVTVIVGANVTTQLLKNVVLERGDFGVWLGYNSLPSGHATVAASAVCALYLVTPRLARPVLALVGTTFVALIGSATVVVGWHRPADVLVSIAIAMAWLAIAVLVIGGVQVRRRLFLRTILPATLGATVAVVALLSAGARPAEGGTTIIAATLVHGSVALSAALLTVLSEWVAPSRMMAPSPVRVARPAPSANTASPV